MTRRVKLGTGIGDIKFGMLSSDIVNSLGQPDETEQETHEDGGTTQTLIYEELGLLFDFGSVDNFRLNSISINAEDITVERLMRPGLSKQKVFDNLENLDWGEAVLEDISPEDDNVVIEVIWFDKVNVSIWLEDDVVYEVEFGPFWKNDDTFIWPKLSS
ncbi:MAG: hypothetical protein AB8B69_17380 [Chitinophagales bacterium]